MSDTIKVTVDGEPVTREVTREQVNSYLRRNGWCIAEQSEGSVRWGREGAGLWISRCPDGDMLSCAVERLARHEGRCAAAVLREIAGDVEPAPTRADLLADRREALAHLSYDGTDLGLVEAVKRRNFLLRDATDKLEIAEKQRAGLLAAVEEAHVALHEMVDRAAHVRIGNEATNACRRAHDALHRVATGQRDRSPAEKRADEIEASRFEMRGLDLRGVVLRAADAHQATDRPQWRLTEAAAWLIVAQRILAREAAR